MSSKLNFIPFIGSYDEIRNEMNDDLQYRLRDRLIKTSLGRPLYYRINIQLITTQECPFNCPFCLERQHPTVVETPTLAFIKDYMKMDANAFSFRFLSGLERKDYSVDIWNELQNDHEVDLHTFRIGDFFVYATFDYAGKHARVTLGDMWQQQHNDYQDGYSNIIIHPDGRVTTNWE